MSHIVRITGVVLLLLYTCGTYSQNRKPEIHVSRPLVELVGDSVRMSFLAWVSRLSSNYRIEFQPVFRNDTHELALPRASIAGRNSIRSATRKRLSASSLEGRADLSEFTAVGDTLRYTAVFPFATWMSNYSLSIDQLLKGCCNTEALPTSTAHGTLVYAALVPEEPVPVAEPIVTLSPTELLAQTEGFIRHISAYESDKEAGNYHRDPAALRVYFRQGRTELDAAYLENAATLQRLDHALNVMMSDSTVRITRLLVVGYASIEGMLSLNTCLAGKRAEQLRNYGTARGVSLPAVEIINMSEGWDELRGLVAASDNVPYSQEVLRIIDNVPLLKGRELQLMRLRRGVPYNWMMKHLFPLQRNAGYVRAYYEKVIH